MYSPPLTLSFGSLEVSPDEISERIVAIEHEQKSMRQIVEDHIHDEEAWRIGHDDKVNQIYEVLVGAKGAARVMGWVIVALGAVGATWSWVVSHLNVSLR